MTGDASLLTTDEYQAIKDVLLGLIEMCGAYDGHEFETVAMELRDMLRDDDITVHRLGRAIRAAELGERFTKRAERKPELQHVKAKVEAATPEVHAFEIWYQQLPV